MKLASIEKILDIIRINGADKIELLTILGWQVIVKKGEFNKGDLCIYIPIDTTVNPTRDYFKFLIDPKKKNEENIKPIKIKTIKIKGVFSQGLALPLNIYPYEPVIGLDISEFLDVRKYEKESIINTQDTKLLDNHIPVPFPVEYISKTDEDNLRTKHNILEELINLDCVITSKMDGSSMTIIKDNDNFIVCSRNYVINEDNIMYKFINTEKIKDKIINFNRNLAIQGEFCGPKVNNNQIGLIDYKWYVFTIKDLNTNVYLNYHEMKKLCLEIGLEMVPTIMIFNCTETHNLEFFQRIANDIVYTSHLNKIVPGEGIVVRPLIPKWSQTLLKNLSFKVINQNYKD